jgi:hypothetical protein
MPSAIISVSIGGSVNGIPMPNSKWSKYQAALRDTLTATVGPLDFEQSGYSTWKGISERSYTVNVLEPKRTEVGRLKTDLAQLCHHYGQDAIAMTYGCSTLIEPCIEGQHARCVGSTSERKA